MKTYLGDGVYAEMEPGAVVLTTENGVETTNTIYLDDAVLSAFMRWMKEAALLEMAKPKEVAK